MSPLSKWLRLPSAVFFGRTDERIYAVIRIVFAALALLNLLALWPSRHALFADTGLLDATVAKDLSSPFYPSIFRWIHSETAVTCCLAATAVAVLLLMAGIGTRAAALWVFVWHVSYTARAPLAQTGWDVVLRCYAFLVLVSPPGKCWSLATLLRGARALPEAVSRHGILLMRLQLLVIYWQAVMRRLVNPAPYWGNGEFLSYFFLSHHARWPGRWVLENESLFAAATHAVQLAEVAIPVLLFIKRTRWWGMFLGFLLHAGISLFARDLGLFFLAMMMTYLAFLRPEDMDAFVRILRRLSRRKGGGSSP